MIALVSKNTVKSSGQLWEFNCAKEERIPVRGIYVDVNNKPASLPSEFFGIRVMNRTWDNIANFLKSLQ